MLTVFCLVKCNSVYDKLEWFILEKGLQKDACQWSWEKVLELPGVGRKVVCIPWHKFPGRPPRGPQADHWHPHKEFCHLEQPDQADCGWVGQGEGFHKVANQLRGWWCGGYSEGQWTEAADHGQHVGPGQDHEDDVEDPWRAPGSPRPHLWEVPSFTSLYWGQVRVAACESQLPSPWQPLSGSHRLPMSGGDWRGSGHYTASHWGGWGGRDPEGGVSWCSQQPVVASAWAGPGGGDQCEDGVPLLLQGRVWRHIIADAERPGGGSLCQTWWLWLRSAVCPARVGVGTSNKASVWLWLT